MFTLTRNDERGSLSISAPAGSLEEVATSGSGENDRGLSGSGPVCGTSLSHTGLAVGDGPVQSCPPRGGLV